MAWFRFALLVGGLAGLVGCGDDTNVGGGGAGGAAPGGSDTGGTAAVCTEPEPVPCEDQVILGMNLKDEPAPGEITNTPDGEGFLTLIDATAGVTSGTLTPTESYTYGRFTDAGLEKVSLSDEDALTSMDWDMAFRRYIGRINSGNSGPSCVTAARLPGTPVFDDVSSAPDDLTRRSDEYFTAEPSCELIADGTGLPGSPATALSSYWTYPTCVQMTGNVYIVQLADGRQLKLTVTHFYNDEAQQQCQEEESIPMADTGSGNVQLRWAFLP